MQVSRSTRIALLFLSAFLFQSERLQATPGTVPPGACLYALDPSADRAFQIAGAQSVYSACGVVVESRASDGFEMEGSETLYLENHAQVSVVVGAQLNGQTKLWDTLSNKQVQAVQTTSPGDPLSSIPAPTSGTIVSTSHAYYDMNSKPKNNTLSPGIYCGGLTIGNTNGMTFNFSPGVYVLAGGGFVLNSQAQVSGSGVTFYNTSSAGWGCSQSYSYTPVTISGQVTANLSAPTSGSLDGILLFGNRAGCSTVGSCVDQINGGSTAVLNGALYFASDEIEITGSNVNGFLMLVADKIYINGNSHFGNNGNPFDGVMVNVLPASASLYASQTQTFTATVGNTANTAVTWSISPSGAGTISPSGLYTAPSSVTTQQTVTVTATSQDDDTKYGTATVTLYPPRTTPTISWAAPAAIAYGTALSAAQLDATTSVAGTFTYSPAIGIVLGAGLQTLTVTFTPSNTFLYNSASANVPLTVLKATPTVTWPTPSPIAYGTPLSSTQLDASALVAGSFAYTPGTGAVLATGAQTLSVTFTPADTADYNTATQTAQLTVNPVAPAIAFSVGNQTYGIAPFTVAATSNSAGAITYSVVSGPATIAGSTVTITGAGTVVLQASQAASGNYAAGTQNAPFTVAAEAPAIAFTVPYQTYGVAPFTVSASSNSSGAFTYSVVSGPATISGSTVTVTGVGTVVLQALQAASGNYAAGTQDAPFTVAAATPTITFAVSNQTYGASPFAVTATSNSAGAITYSVVSGPATISGSMVTITGVGTVVLQASQAASGNYAVGTQNTTFAVAPEAQVITFAAPASPVTYGVSPIALSASSSSGLAVTFSVVSGPGTISGSTLTITGPGTVVVAANQAGNADYAAATQVTKSIVITSAVSITVAPSSAALSAGQVQQFTATVSNTSNTAVNWTISPVGVGSINPSGLYTAPATISTQQTVTVTATSQADSAQSASATISLSLAQCALNSYGYMRAIVIDHTKIPNTDQANFPFLFNTTDPLLASTANNGHVTNPNGYDIIFTSDPAGQNLLNYEMEEYNPATGQVVAWVAIPTLSHTTDTVLYMFYGNPAIAAPQQNPAAVWDANFMGVWHVPNGTQLSLADSTTNGDNGTDNGATATAGQVDGGMLTNGSTYATIGASANLANLAHGNATFSAWVNNTGNGGIILGKAGFSEGGWTLGLDQFNTPEIILYDADGGGSYPGAISLASGWNYVAATVAQNTGTPSQNQVSLYVNGVLSGSGAATFSNPIDDTAFPAYLAWNDDSGDLDDTVFGSIVGAEDEFRISNISRSSDWIAAEYNNQASPSTFYALYPENSEGVVPAASILYASQTDQFAVIAACNIPAVTWSIPSGAPGTLSSNGLYTAPASISTQQAVVITANSQADGSTVGSATVTLMPPVSVSVNPGNPTLYVQKYGFPTLQFSASLTNTTDTAVTWTINPAWLGSIDPTGLYTAPEFLSSLETLTVTATSRLDPTKSGSTTLTLSPPVGIQVSPSGVVVYGGNSQQFTATVYNFSNPAVTWSTSPTGFGTIDQTGLYNAPTNVATNQAVEIIATSQGNPAFSGWAYIYVIPAVSVTPAAATLIGGQTQQFSGEVCSSSGEDTSCGNNINNWAISPSGAGTITSSGLYTAPETVASQQTVTVTAISPYIPADQASATVTLIPPLVSVSPGATTLYSSQTEQFSAKVTNSSNTGVTWSIVPAEAGSISTSGLYTAPPGIASQQTVSIIATSQAVPTLSYSAVVTLSPTQCAAKAYSYVRAITIDHRKVPNTDQVNFPFLFSATDPTLASVANGGHVASSNGDDILFSSDTAGINRLDYEIQEYNPASGQILAWVRIPTLTHGSDTVIYMFYGNSSISAPQQNPGGVWDSDFQSVYHLNNAGSGVAVDSTAYGNSVPAHGLTSTQGEFDAASGFSGTQSYIELPSADFVSFPANGQVSSSFSASFGVWFKSSSEGVILDQIGGEAQPGNGPLYAYIPAMYLDSSGSVRGSFFSLNGSNNSPAPQLATQAGYNDNRWHIAALTYGNGAETMYVDGQTVGSDQNAVQIGYYPSYGYFVGTGYDLGWANVSATTGWDYFKGALEEVEVSNVARTADWMQAEYFNQSSPSTFFALSQEVSGGITLNPVASSLSAGQSQQFTVLEQPMCGSGSAVWSMPAGSPGALSSSGLYTAPASIDTQQTVTITVTTLGNTSTQLTATVTLMPAVAMSLTPSSVTLLEGQFQQFTPTVSNTPNTAVNWSINPTGIGSVSGSGLYIAPATVTTEQTINLTATSAVDSSRSASATITLLPPPPVLSVSVSVTPGNASVLPGQSQQFGATVGNAADTSVTWSIVPAGTGAISASGLYTAPGTIAVQQAVTVVATSNADSTKSASAMIDLIPSGCAAGGYGYQRAIVIDHTKVSNSDQSNFPILINTIDPLFATVGNGGHVNSANGYDILFSTDPNGLTKLDHELEQYNPATGQVVAWVRIPTLSHSVDTTLYVFYGNPNITEPQQNPEGVWDLGYQAVYHFANGASGIATDSTGNANNGTANNVSPTSGEIDGAAIFDGGSSFIQVPTAAFPAYPSNSSTSAYPLSFGAWFKTTSGGVILGQTDGTQPGGGPNGWAPALYVDTAGSLRASMFYHGNVSEQIVTTTSYNDNKWHYAVDTYSNGTEKLYVDGKNAGSQPGVSDVPNGAPYAYFLGTGQTNAWPASGGGWDYFGGNLDEVRVSNNVRSSDWVATEFNNQSSPATFYSFQPESPLGVVPFAATLYALQSQQFTATGACTSAVNWSLSSGAPGTITTGGLYTAPANIAMQQSIAITATSQINSAIVSSATVVLMPSVSISVSPLSATLSQNQTQQIVAVVANSTSPAVTWTLSPAGVGMIDGSGVYTAPSVITGQETVTITATSAEDPTKSASATITLVPSQCASSGFGYQRVIVIDHTKVPNSDQTNFPFLFNTTDPDLASIDNNGHVANSNGYDIIFSTDPNGLTKLDHELETYSPATGQVVAWVRIPTLSHTVDTVLYVFYGNPSITTSQQNPAGVWNQSYQAVYHLASAGAANDSTIYANNATPTAVLSATGVIDGAAGFNGASSYLQIPSADFPNYPTGAYSNIGLPQTSDTTTFAASFGAWFKTASPGGILVQVPSIWIGDCYFFICYDGPTLPGDYDPAGWNSMLYVDDSGKLVGAGVTSTSAYNDNNWHFAVLTYATDGTNTLYVDGQSAGATQGNFPPGYSAAYEYFVGTAYTFLANDGNWNWLYLNGSVDEVSVSNTPFSGDWIQTEYNNQGSVATFYKFYSRSTVQVTPSAVSLYPSESQQFAVPGSCDAAVAWTMPSSAPGTLTTGGLYTAPGSVTSQQTVAITASSPATGTTIGSATVTLLAPALPITLVATAPGPYPANSSQTFNATVVAEDGTPVSGIVVNFAVTGANSTFGSGTTGSNGIASYTYTGANTGEDTIQATASISGELVTSSNISASWITPVPLVTTEAVTLTGPPSLGPIGLVGAFTDSNGAVIEPIAIGALPWEFIVPQGATQLQLGVNDNRFANDGGAGFVVTVNGVAVPVPPTALPWNWIQGGLNNNYQFGASGEIVQNYPYGPDDDTKPVIAATGLTQGTIVTVAYQSGTASANFPISPFVKANGDQSNTTGAKVSQGTYYPTVYTTASSYPLGQAITFNALVTDSTGAPIPNVPVSLNITGANSQQLQAVSDSTGTAAFLYSGLNAGTDHLQAQAYPAGGPTLFSSQGSVAWINYPVPPPAGSITLKRFAVANDFESYTVQIADGSGNPISNANFGVFVWGVDNFALSGTTDPGGNASFGYTHSNPGPYNVVVVDSIGRNVVFSLPYSNTWVPPNSTSGCNDCNVLTVSISAQNTLTLPSTLQLNGTVSDSTLPSGTPIPVLWTQVSGPGTVTFAAPQQASTTAAFSEPGVYLLQLAANDSDGSASAQFVVTVSPAPATGVPQGWIGSPLYGSTVSGLVPITLAPGISLESGVLTYFPTNNTASVSILNPNTTGSGQIGLLDTTTISNGSYWIELNGTETGGESEHSLILVNVTGNYKPGRVTATVTDLVVPATGLAISIQRTYDSLNAATSGDFGYGWNLGINVNLSVGPDGSVTFTLGGQRRTFYLTPQPNGFLPYYTAAFTPQPGFFGTHKDSAPGCADDFDFLVPDGSLWFCVDGGQYNPPGYVYTDPSGTSYTISASGGLQGIQDRSGNGLTITPTGITSTTGLNVPFVRDSQNRITQITDPNGNVYSYGYDAYGQLDSVTYPNTPQSSTYTYTPTGHYYLSGTDFRNNPLPVTAYYDSTTDNGNTELDGRLLSVQDAVGNTTSYAYNLSSASIVDGVSVLNTGVTTITYPNSGIATLVYDSYGMLLSSTDQMGNTTTNVYDANHNLISVKDPLGHVNTYSYDQNGNRTSQSYPATATSTNTTSYATYGQYSAPLTYTDEKGNIRQFTYDANGNLAGVTDTVNSRSANVVSSIYGSNGLLQAVAVGADLTVTPAATSTFTYDSNGNVASATNPLGNTTLYTYDALGRVVSLIRKGGASSTSNSRSASHGSASGARANPDFAPRMPESAFGSNRASSGLFGSRQTARPSLQPRTMQQGSNPSSSLPSCNPNLPQSFSVTYTYSAMYGVSSEVDSLGRSASATYDGNGNMTSYTDANGNTYQYAYDALNRLTNIALPTRPATGYSFSYDYANNVIDAVDPEGHHRHNVYDLAGRLTSVTLAYGTASATTTTFSYNNDGTLQSTTDALGHATSYSYDAAGNLTQAARGSVSVRYAYDNARNRISSTDGNGNVTTFQYDARQRLQQIGFMDHTQQTINYDDANNVTGVVDQAGHIVDYGYDTSNNLVSVMQANSSYPSADTVNYCRDGLGNLASSADANGHVTSQKVDALGRPTSLTYPDGTNGLGASYDGNSNLVSLSKVSAAGSPTATFTYDSLNRLVSESPDASYGEPTVNFTYTANGLLSKMTDGSGTTNYTYDSLDRITSKSTQAGTLNYTYDAVGNVATMSSGDQRVSVSYTYDDLNRLSTVVDNTLPAGQNTTTYSYDPASNLATAIYPNGLQATYTYDELNRLSQTSTAISSYQYQRDANGNILTDTEANNRSVNYSYDGLDQLTGETVVSDPSNVNGSITYSLDPVGNRLSDQSTLGPVGSTSTTFNADDQAQTDSYDSTGDTIATGGNSYAYNSWLRLVSMNGGQVALAYNGLGQLVSKTANGITTQYLIDDLSPTGYPQVVEELVNGQVSRQYTYGLERINELQTVNNTPTASFYQYDGRGTVRMLTNSAGAVTDTYEYDAFGNEIAHTGSTPNAYLYRGERYDSDLGLYYLRARWYNPVTGRFMTRDPYEGSIYDPAACTATTTAVATRPTSSIHRAETRRRKTPSSHGAL
jgi:RHS repeat-associated protein